MQLTTLRGEKNVSVTDNSKTTQMTRSIARGEFHHWRSPTRTLKAQAVIIVFETDHR
jgi:hypothetical protein